MNADSEYLRSAADQARSNGLHDVAEQRLTEASMRDHLAMSKTTMIERVARAIFNGSADVDWNHTEVDG